LFFAVRIDVVILARPEDSLRRARILFKFDRRINDKNRGHFFATTTLAIVASRRPGGASRFTAVANVRTERVRFPDSCCCPASVVATETAATETAATKATAAETASSEPASESAATKTTAAETASSEPATETAAAEQAA
jgi:hypothetical protein